MNSKNDPFHFVRQYDGNKPVHKNSDKYDV